jgi:iron complex outermembrane recepter protein
VRLSIAAAVACLSIVGAVASDHAQASIRKSTNIPAQELGAALQALAQEHDLQVVYLSDSVDERKTAGAVGELTAEEALKQLLKGTGCSYRYLDEKTVTIIPNPPAHGDSSGKQKPAARSTADNSDSQGASGDGGQGKAFWDRFRLAQGGQGTTSGPTSVGAQNENSQESSKPVTLQEVIVTAQKRAERLQDVPISITAVGGADLDTSHYQGISEALTTVPGVSVIGQNGSSVNGGGSQIAIRGVTANGTVFNGASPIGYYIDSVPFGLVRSGGVPDMDAYDLQRVEVLRGPQGTLYGANSEGGLIRILTNDADLNGGFDFKTRGSLSTTDGAGGASYGGDAAANFPIVDGVLAARLVVGDQHYAGWINSPTQLHLNDTDQLNLRLKINAQPTDYLSIALSAWHSRDTYGGLSTGLESEYVTTTLPTPGSVGYDAYGFKIGYDFKLFSFLSQTSYLDYESAQHIDITALGFPPGPLAPLYIGTTTGIFSQELTLASTLPGPWQWTAGAFFRNGHDEFTELGEVFAEPLYLPDTSKSEAIYGELSQRFLHDQLQWTLGGRYFHDEVTSSSRGPVAPGAPPYYESFSYDKFTPRAVLTWFPSRNLTIYGSYSQGFRSGMPQDGLVGVGAPQVPPLKPDTLNNYEVGTKGSLFDNRVVFNAAVYYIEWKDVQQQLLTTINSLSVDAYVNSKSASGPGVEFSLQFRPLNGLDLALDAGWNDLEFDSNVCCQGNGGIAFYKGQRLEYSPEYTAGASVDYSFPVGAGFRTHLSASANYTSAINSGLASDETLLEADPIFITRAHLALEIPNHWMITLYGDNLANNREAVALAYAAPDYTERLRPRTVGLQIEYHLK